VATEVVATEAVAVVMVVEVVAAVMVEVVAEVMVTKIRIRATVAMEEARTMPSPETRSSRRPEGEVKKRSVIEETGIAMTGTAAAEMTTMTDAVETEIETIRTRMTDAVMMIGMMIGAVMIATTETVDVGATTGMTGMMTAGVIEMEAGIVAMMTKMTDEALEEMTRTGHRLLPQIR